MYSNSCSSRLFKPEIIKIGPSSHNLYSNKILNFQQSAIILNACTKKFWHLYIHYKKICPENKKKKEVFMKFSRTISSNRIFIKTNSEIKKISLISKRSSQKNLSERTLLAIINLLKKTINLLIY